MERRKIVLDVDEVLLPCIPIMCDIVSKNEQVELKEKDITVWGFANLTPRLRDACYSVLNSGEVFAQQKPFPEAVAFVESLLARNLDVCIGSAVDVQFMTIRGRQICKYFPMIPECNLMLGKRKDMLECDFLLDDSSKNIESSIAKHPMLMDKPWNQDCAAKTRVFSYKEVLSVIDRVFADDLRIVCDLSAAGKTAYIRTV